MEQTRFPSIVFLSSEIKLENICSEVYFTRLENSCLR